MSTPAEHAAAFKDWALADGCPDGQWIITRANARYLAERATELERKLEVEGTRAVDEAMSRADAEARAEYAQESANHWLAASRANRTRVEQLERELEHWKSSNLYPSTYRAAVERAEQLEQQLAEEREEHSATCELVRGEREFKGLLLQRAAQLETALREARASIVRLNSAGFDSFRREIAEEAVSGIDAALDGGTA